MNKALHSWILFSLNVKWQDSQSNTNPNVKNLTELGLELADLLIVLKINRVQEPFPTLEDQDLSGNMDVLANRRRMKVDGIQ